MFLTAARGLARGAIVSMELSGAVGDGVVHSHVPLEPLVQIAGLRDIDRNATAILGLPGINVHAGQRLERSVQGMDLKLIQLSGLPGPVDTSRSLALRLPVTTK